jgi:putative transposase
MEGAHATFLKEPLMSKRFTLEQIVRVLCEADAGCSVQELSERYGFDMKTYQEWRDRLIGSQASLAQRLAHLEEENDRLKRLQLLAERAIELKVKEVCRSTAALPSWWATQEVPMEWPELPSLPEATPVGGMPAQEARTQQCGVAASEGAAAELQR